MSDYDHKAECERYGGGGSVRRAYDTIIEPGKNPEGKGPFLTLKHLNQFVREAIEHRPDPSTHIVVYQLTWNDELWTECGRESSDCRDFVRCEKSAIDAKLDRSRGS